MSDTDTTDEVDYDGPAEPWQPPQGWDTLERLDWHARKARAIQARLDRLNELFDREIQRLEDRREEEAATLLRRLEWHRAPIESYHRAHPDDRTLKLPNATSKLTVPRTPRIFAVDIDAMAEWARAEHPEIMRGPNITDVRRLVTVADDDRVVDTATGEVVPCLRAEVGEPSWTLSLEPGEPI